MEPAQALRRIAYLLEAAGAQGYKAQAFRRAAATVDGTAPALLAKLCEQHRLATLKSVGATTATVIAQAMSGGVPEYLATLEERATAMLSGPVEALLRALRGDCHSHSNWSDGGTSIEEMARAAIELGHEYLVVTDHSPRLSVANGLTADRLQHQLDVIADLNRDLAPFRLLTGIEVDIVDDGSLDQERELLQRLDVVVASVHSKLRMEWAEMTQRMVTAVRDPNVDILGHCTGRLLAGRGRPQSSFDPETVFGACARTGTAVEINSRPERQDPPQDLLRVAVAAGCLFSIDTDAHAPGQLSWLRIGCQLAHEGGVDRARVVNTMKASELLSWTGER